MDSVLQTIADLVDAEHRVTMRWFDPACTPARHSEGFRALAARFFGDAGAHLFSLSERDDFVLSDPAVAQGARDRKRKRRVFAVARYRDPRLGAELAGRIGDDEIFVCLLGPNEISDLPEKRLSDAYRLGWVGDALQVVDRDLFVQGTWQKSHGWAPAQVHDPGALVALRILEEPEEGDSARYLRALAQSLP